MKQTFIALALGTALSLFANEEECCIPQNCGFRYWLDASFTYWFAKEDGLNVAESAQVDGTATTVFASSPAVFQQEFGYHPGFKLGMGLSSAEDWSLYTEYTYYRGQNKISKNAPDGSTGVGVWSLDSWYLQETFFSHQSLTGTALSSSWKIALDMGDLLLSRPMSQDPGFVFIPFAGLRTLWIRQQMNLDLTIAAASFGGSSFLGPQPVASRTQSHAWGLGPRAGVNGQYNLPMGFSLDGAIGATLFFTRFTDVKHSEQAAASFYATPAPIQMSYNCVRPEFDLNLGLGWQKWICATQRLNLAATYDFSYFWGQNILRSFMDEYVAGTSSGSLDLYFFGVTLTAAYEF